MDPNSQNQVWSLWTVTVTGGFLALPSTPAHYKHVKFNAARFMRDTFGTASTMRIVHDRNGWTFQVRTEGTPAHDPELVAEYAAAFEKFFRNGFGTRATVTTTVKFEAGSKQDGKPSDQLLILPRLEMPRELAKGLATDGKRAL